MRQHFDDLGSKLNGILCCWLAILSKSKAAKAPAVQAPENLAKRRAKRGGYSRVFIDDHYVQMMPP